MQYMSFFYQKERINGNLVEIPVPEEVYIKWTKQNGFRIIRKNVKKKKCCQREIDGSFQLFGGVIWENIGIDTKSIPVGLLRQIKDLGKLLKLIFYGYLVICKQEKCFYIKKSNNTT